MFFTLLMTYVFADVSPHVKMRWSQDPHCKPMSCLECVEDAYCMFDTSKNLCVGYDYGDNELVIKSAECPARGVVGRSVHDRLARDNCMSDCRAKNPGPYSYDNCLEACSDGSPTVFNAEVAKLDSGLKARGVYDHPRFAREAGNCFSTCYAKNGHYMYDECLEACTGTCFSECRAKNPGPWGYDGCLEGCTDKLPVTFNADVAKLSSGLHARGLSEKDARRKAVSSRLLFGQNNRQGRATLDSSLDRLARLLEEGRRAREGFTTCMDDCYEEFASTEGGEGSDDLELFCWRKCQ